MDGARRIFLVDDDLGIRSALRFWAEVEGYELVAFESAEDFLAECSNWIFDSSDGDDHLYDLHIIVDLNLPGINGHELIRRISPPFNRQQFTIITAKKRDVAGSLGTSIDGVLVLEKPFDLDELEGQIRQTSLGKMSVHSGLSDAS